MSLGNLFIISAPSGAGKTRLVQHLINTLPLTTLSISYTTRAPRPGEQHGIDYYFVEQTEFLKRLALGEFMEHAEVFGNYYGTSKATIDQFITSDQDVVLEIDWQGAQQVKSKFPEAISIFILPPSKQELEQRLINRAQDEMSVIMKRLDESSKEISHAHEYDYLVVNDCLEQAKSDLVSIVQSHRLKQRTQSERLAALLTALTEKQ